MFVTAANIVSAQLPASVAELHPDTAIRDHPTRGVHVIARRSLYLNLAVLDHECPIAVVVTQGCTQCCEVCTRVVDQVWRCKQCASHFCSWNCRETSIHRKECAALAAVGTLEHSSSARLALRLVAAVEQWEHRVAGLEQHQSDEANEERAVKAVACLKPWLDQAGADICRQVTKAARLINCNGFSLLQAEGAVKATAIYSLASRINHSCTPNCVPSFDPSGAISVCTTRAVRQGESLCISYCDPWQDVHTRRAVLVDKWFFSCDCPRCQHESNGQNVHSEEYTAALEHLSCQIHHTSQEAAISLDAMLDGWDSLNSVDGDEALRLDVHADSCAVYEHRCCWLDAARHLYSTVCFKQKLFDGALAKCPPLPAGWLRLSKLLAKCRSVELTLDEQTEVEEMAAVADSVMTQLKQSIPQTQIWAMWPSTS